MRAFARLLAALLLLLLAGAAPPPPGAASPTDAAAVKSQLLEFKASFENGNIVLDYFNDSTDPCTWQNEPADDWTQGVTCVDGLVTHIIIQGPYHKEPLRGTIPSAGWDLPASLEVLDLGMNELSGSLPPILLPLELGSLNLYQNRLTGTIPTNWPLLTSLVGLLLHNNNLVGTLPAWPALPKLNATVKPGNEWLCGQTPAAPLWVQWGPVWNTLGPLSPLPSCDAAQLLAFKATFTNGDARLPTWNSGTQPCDGEWEGVTCNTLGQVTKIAINSVGELSLNRPAVQSTTEPGGDASNAVDGNSATWWDQGSCTHTANSDNPWWYVDLGQDWQVHELTITNRCDCCSERLRDLDIHVTALQPSFDSASFRSAVTRCTSQPGVANNTCSEGGGRLIYKCDAPLVGRYVSVQILATNAVLTLCEVQVWGSTIQGPNHRESLRGTIPSDGWDLPAYLKVLDLGMNKLSGPLPPMLLPPKLEELHLYRNGLTGTIPMDWKLPTSLEALLLHANKLAGTLPTWPTLPKLNATVKPGNQWLCGQAPSAPLWVQWGLVWNTLEPLSPLPSCGTAMLLAMKATFTNGDEKLPDWNSNIHPCDGERWEGITCEQGQITKIYIGDRALEGTVPPNGGWQLPDSLQELSLTNNSISGTIPIRLSMDLKVLDLSWNKLTGGIPDGPWVPKSLTHLWLGNNRQLGGPIPLKWSLPSSITVMGMDQLGLTGAIPENWDLPSNLTQLWLGSNNFSQIPTNLTFPDSLQRFWLDSNPAMKGAFPGSGWKLGNGLVEFGLHGCALSGTISPELNLPPNLELMTIFLNSLTGSLPSLTDWPSLEAATFVRILVRPGNAGLCEAAGFVPSLKYRTFTNQDYKGQQLEPLDTCAPPPPPPPPPPAPPSPVVPEATSSSVGPIVGAAIGGVCVVAVVLAGLWWCRRRRRQRSQAHLADPEVPHGSKPNTAPGGESNKASPLDSLLVPTPDDPWTLGALQSYQRSQLATATNSSVNDSAWATFQGGSAAVVPHLSPASSASTAPLKSAQSGFSGRVDMKPWAINFSEVELTRIIGEGSAGRVFLAKWQQMPVAVKILTSLGTGVDAQSAANLAMTMSNPVLAGLQAEASTMASLRHPCCVNFLGVCTYPPCVITEWCSRGSLADVLWAGRSDPAMLAQLSWSRRINMAIEAASGMLYLHSRAPPVLHRDLKSPNLLIDQDWHCKVCDFNLAKVMEETQQQMASSAVATNPRWIAPEVLHGERATFATDVFSFGIVLWELLTWQLPWATGSINPFQIYREVTAGVRPPIPEDPSALPGGTFSGMPAYLHLMQRCWAQQAGERPTFAEVVSELRGLPGTDE